MNKLLEIEGLTKRYGEKLVLEDINLSINEREILGLIGESGSGKSTLAKIVMQLVRPCSGTILYKGERFGKDFRKKMQMVFQNPYSSLNPKMNGRKLVEEAFEIHNLPKKGRAEELFEKVGLDVSLLDRYTHELSGGQRQRISIARALAVEPEFLVCDEPISALDLSVQAQVVNMLKTLQKEKAMTYLVIGHDLTMMHHLCDRIAVMHQGKIVEIADAETLFSSPKHPYTQNLLSSIPARRPANREEHETTKII